MTLTLNDTLVCLPHNIEQKRIKLLLQEMCKNSFYLKYYISSTYTIFTILFR